MSDTTHLARRVMSLLFRRVRRISCLVREERFLRAVSSPFGDRDFATAPPSLRSIPIFGRGLFCAVCGFKPGVSGGLRLSAPDQDQFLSDKNTSCYPLFLFLLSAVSVPRCTRPFQRFYGLSDGPAARVCAANPKVRPPKSSPFQATGHDPDMIHAAGAAKTRHAAQDFRE